MGYTVTLDIKNSEFPELGNPVYPPTYDSVKQLLPKENKNKVKDDYESYSRNAGRVSADLISGNFFSNILHGGKNSVNGSELCLQFDYQEGIPKTYKFLGMDIDDDYNAVIPMGDGYIKVGPMFDRERMKVMPLSSYSYGKEVSTLVENVIDSNLTESVVRTLSTAIKTGALYSMSRFDSLSDSETVAQAIKTLRLSDLDPLVTLIKDKLFPNGGEGNSGKTYKFKSVLLNIVDMEKTKDLSDKAKDTGFDVNSSNSDSTIVAGVIVKIFKYWQEVISNYNEMSILVSEIDLWSDLGKKSLGDIEFNRRFKKAFSMVNQEDGSQINDKIISFAGTAKDDGILDANVFRSSASSQLGIVESIMSGITSYNTVSLQDLMVSNIDTLNFSNPYELNMEELQAMSSYDSLKYVDEDVNVCISSYNMDDEEDRSLFVKSAIKSYDRNFRAFKPRNDYDVSQAFTDMVERGVTFSDKIVSKSVESPEQYDNYEVTSSVAAIDRNAAKKSLIKVGKLLNKSLDAVYDLFGGSSQAPTALNP